jgi:hypothetical protein
MTESTRRSFLAVASMGTAAAVAAVVVPGVAAAATTPEGSALPADAQGDMAAYVRDVTKGEIALMVDGREVVVTDKKLVARLAHAFAGASQN